MSAAPEPLENPLKLILWNADTAIRNAHGDLAVGAADLDLHRSLGFGIAHRIIKKHQKKLPEPSRVATHDFLRPAVGESDIDGLGMGDDLGVAADFLQQIAEV